MLARSPRARSAGWRPRPARRATSSRIAGAVSAGRRWVKTVATAARFIPARPPARRRRGPRSARGRPASASHTNVSRLPFGPGSPLEAKPRTAAPSSRAAASPTATSALRRAAGSRTTPPLPTAARPTSNCGLTIARQSYALRGAGEHGREHLGQRDERDIDHDQLGSVRERRREAASRAFLPLEHRHARIGAQPKLQLAVGDIERDDVRGSALEQAIGEPAGRGADVKRARARDRDAEGIERVGELDPAPRDVRRRGPRPRARRRRRRAARACGPARVRAQQHVAGHHRRRRPGSGLEQPAVHQQAVDPHPRHHRTACQARFGALRDQAHTSRPGPRGILESYLSPPGNGSPRAGRSRLTAAGGALPADLGVVLDGRADALSDPRCR